MKTYAPSAPFWHHLLGPENLVGGAKTLAAILVLLIGATTLPAQNVGIGVADPLARLHIEGGGLLVRGVAGSTPVSGPGRRMMWVPERAAFRAGEVTGAQWNDANMGDHSIGLGFNTRAPGEGSVAIGYQVAADGYKSYVFGTRVNAFDDEAVVIGVGRAGGSLTNTYGGTMMLGMMSSQPSIFINSGSGSTPGRVGIWTTNPQAPLHVGGTARADTLQAAGLRITGGPPQPGYVLTCLDASGTAAWAPGGGGGGGGAGWSTTGNAGTDPATNFIGTTDGQPLVVRAGNEVVRFNPNGEIVTRDGHVRIGTPKVGGGGIPEGVVIGKNASSTSVGNLIAIGSYAAENLGINENNICIGYRVLRSATGSSILGNVIMGTDAGYHPYRDGLHYSVMIGYEAGISYNGDTINHGSNNVFIGHRVGADTTVIYATCVGSHLYAAHNGVFLAGDGADGGHWRSTAHRQFRTRFRGGYQLYTNAAATIGASLPANGNSWVTMSDSALKAGFAPADAESVLVGIRGLRLGSWHYRGQPATHRHYGPMAQEFFAAFGSHGGGSVGTDTTIATADADGVLFIAAQGLEARTRALQLENAELRAQLEGIKREQAAAATRLAALEAQKRETEARLARLEAALGAPPATAASPGQLGAGGR